MSNDNVTVSTPLVSVDSILRAKIASLKAAASVAIVTSNIITSNVITNDVLILNFEDEQSIPNLQAKLATCQTPFEIWEFERTQMKSIIEIPESQCANPRFLDWTIEIRRIVRKRYEELRIEFINSLGLVENAMPD